MEKKELILLSAEIQYQISEIDKIILRVEDRTKGDFVDEKVLESASYQLHNLYCAFEDLFKIVAKFFENCIEDPSRYHIELLKRMTLDIDGIRPPLINEKLAEALEELRAFRHFFRHAYSYVIDSKKLILILDKYEFIKKNYKKDVEKFLNSLLEE